MGAAYRVVLGQGASVYGCCEGHAQVLLGVLPEASAFGAVEVPHGGKRCAYCGWCGGPVGELPAVCVWHGVGGCPLSDGRQMVCVPLAVRMFARLHGALPSSLTVEGWVALVEEEGVLEPHELVGL